MPELFGALGGDRGGYAGTVVRLEGACRKF